MVLMLCQMHFKCEYVQNRNNRTGPSQPTKRTFKILKRCTMPTLWMWIDDGDYREAWHKVRYLIIEISRSSQYQKLKYNPIAKHEETVPFLGQRDVWLRSVGYGLSTEVSLMDWGGCCRLIGPEKVNCFWEKDGILVPDANRCSVAMTRECPKGSSLIPGAATLLLLSWEDSWSVKLFCIGFKGWFPDWMIVEKYGVWISLEDRSSSWANQIRTRTSECDWEMQVPSWLRIGWDAPEE